MDRPSFHVMRWWILVQTTVYFMLHSEHSLDWMSRPADNDPFGGAGGGGQQVAYFFDLQLVIPGINRYRVPLGFTTALDRQGIGLLGQNGFFDRFQVAFDLRNRIFVLNR
jgi:hypothetical protein